MRMSTPGLWARGRSTRRCAPTHDGRPPRLLAAHRTARTASYTSASMWRNVSTSPPPSAGAMPCGQRCLQVRLLSPHLLRRRRRARPHPLLRRHLRMYRRRRRHCHPPRLLLPLPQSQSLILPSPPRPPQCPHHRQRRLLSPTRPRGPAWRLFERQALREVGAAAAPVRTALSGKLERTAAAFRTRVPTVNASPASVAFQARAAAHGASLASTMPHVGRVCASRAVDVPCPRPPSPLRHRRCHHRHLRLPLHPHLRCHHTLYTLRRLHHCHRRLRRCSRRRRRHHQKTGRSTPITIDGARASAQQAAAPPPSASASGPPPWHS